VASDAEEKVVGRVQADAAIVKLESIDSKVRATSPQIFLARNLSLEIVIEYTHITPSEFPLPQIHVLPQDPHG
jgi:hypothetical protein